MKDALQVRVWTLLTRVRQLRVERARHLLREAHLGVQRAEADTVSRENAIAEHETRRRKILAACFCGESASLWRMALQRHDAGKFALESALAVVCDAREKAQERVMSALYVLQKEMRGLDDARKRVRRLVVAQQEDSDPDD
ncbi:hypothetical protein CIC12_00460 [Burkholderia sp. SG-MS1]|uniref:hypothetical protein n=1 Tax=Paraburkholderia sp. SG-MS1 TaxID=2023741 RepID=UPI001445EC0C|nr:hypothetical protein [Paraburkholderia sp. SG-MS1]NKJ45243.1 hypothetical protein [Paraburkholderia sp. SG-MS1]